MVVPAWAALHARYDRMLGHDAFTVTPRRGELIVFDKLARPLLDHILLAVPSATTKGVLLAPTVFGNLLLGPTADDVHDKRDTSSTATGLAYLRAESERIMPATPSKAVGPVCGVPSSRTCSPGGSVSSVTVDTIGSTSRLVVVDRPPESCTVR